MNTMTKISGKSEINDMPLDLKRWVIQLHYLVRIFLEFYDQSICFTFYL